jgi:hypothetical protein
MRVTTREHAMPLLSKKDWTGYLVELFVVVLGILIAFQVDEWREGLQVERDRHAALIRLKEETQTNIRNCEIAIPLFLRLARSMQLVLTSIQSGRLREGDIDEFEYGLTHIGFLPGRPYLTSVADEMIATGLLKELNIAGLHTNIASAQIQSVQYRQNVATQSRFLQPIVHELARNVEYKYVGEIGLDDLRNAETMGAFEDGIEVTYDFESLVNNRYLANLLVETADGYIDLYRMNYEFCARIDEINDALTKLGIDQVTSLQ